MKGCGFSTRHREAASKKYLFELSPRWLEHLQKASVPFNPGGSGSFVSPNGLVITNLHVGADTLQKMGRAERNYLRDGFYAKTQADEIKSTDLEVNVLISIVNLTPRVASVTRFARCMTHSRSWMNC